MPFDFSSCHLHRPFRSLLLIFRNVAIVIIALSFPRNHPLNLQKRLQNCYNAKNDGHVPTEEGEAARVFRLLSRRIVFISFLTISVCTVLIGIFSYEWAKRTVHSEFAGVSSSYFAKSGDSIVQYMNSMEETAKVMLDNPVIAHEIRQPYVSTKVQPVLDNFSLSLDAKLLGISIYKTDGTLYSLSRMSNIPSLDQLREDARIRDFLTSSSAPSAWLLRDRDLAYYSVNSYAVNGTLTYLAKAFDDNGSLLGVMVIDLDLHPIFDFFGTTNKLFRDSELFLVGDNGEVVDASADAQKRAPAAGDLDPIKKDPKGSFISAKGHRLVLFQTVLNADAKMVMSLPLSNADSQLRALRWSIILYTFLFGALAVVLAVMLRGSIIKPLSQLYKRIRTFQ